jgi:hypothetical protein
MKENVRWIGKRGKWKEKKAKKEGFRGKKRQEEEEKERSRHL